MEPECASRMDADGGGGGNGVGNFLIDRRRLVDRLRHRDQVCCRGVLRLSDSMNPRAVPLQRERNMFAAREQDELPLLTCKLRKQSGGGFQSLLVAVGEWLVPQNRP